MEECKIKNLYNLEQTIAKDIFTGVTYPWEVLPKIEEFIINLGKNLDKDEYEERGENIWIAKSAKVAPTAYIAGPTIIGEIVVLYLDQSGVGSCFHTGVSAENHHPRIEITQIPGIESLSAAVVDKFHRDCQTWFCQSLLVDVEFDNLRYLPIV